MSLIARANTQQKQARAEQAAARIKKMEIKIHLRFTDSPEGNEQEWTYRTAKDGKKIEFTGLVNNETHREQLIAKARENAQVNHKWLLIEDGFSGVANENYRI